MTAISGARAHLGRYRDAALEILAGPARPRQYRALFNPVQPGTGRVISRRALTDRASALLIETHSAWPGHLPGQHVRVGVDISGTRRWRTYSITSPGRGVKPDQPMPSHHFEIAVQAIPDGLVSPFLAHEIRPGTLLQVRPPEGEFVLPPDVSDRVLLLSAGSGITPIIGFLRSGLAQMDGATLVHTAPRASDVMFGPELRALAESTNLQVLEHFTTEHGRFDPASLTQIAPDFAQCQTWACGPPGFLEQLEMYWRAQGCQDKLHVERFQPRIRHAGSGGLVTFGDAGPTVSSDGSKTLLTVGEANGVAMPSGCRMGICYGCALPLASGAVRDLRTGTITSAEPGEHITVQTCISGNAGDCVLSA